MSIEKDKKPIESATRLTGSVAIRIEQKRNMKEYTFGRHWNHESLFVSALNRESIDLLKEHFRDEVPKEVCVCARVRSAPGLLGALRMASPWYHVAAGTWMRVRVSHRAMLVLANGCSSLCYFGRGRRRPCKSAMHLGVVWP